jgi:putative oxidoreductase
MRTTTNVHAYTALFGRVLLAALFLYSGIGKLMAPDATQAYIAASGMPFPMLGYLGALFVEVVLVTLLIVGFQTRLSAAAMAAFTLLTAFIFHSAFDDQGQLINFLKNVSIAGGLLQVAAFGGGALSIDARHHRQG